MTGLTKTFPGVPALVDLTLDVPRGLDVTGSSVPNGAGKTTAIRILAGLMLPNAWQRMVAGSPVTDGKDRTNIGYLGRNHGSTAG